MNEIVRAISELLTKAPLLALETYRAALREPAPMPEILERSFAAPMAFIQAGQEIGSEDKLEELPRRYASARRQDRLRMITAAVDQLVQFGVVADMDHAAPERALLDRIGKKFPKLILEGALHQRLACKLATRLGFPRDVPMPKSVCDLVIDPLIDALIVVLRLGAPTTRDAAVEGLGGLLKIAGGDPAIRFRHEPPLPVEQEKDEPDENYAERAKISKKYFERLERRRLMVLTIAGHEQSRAEYCQRLETPLHEALDALCKGEEIAWGEVEDLLYDRPDLLRILPAVVRQNLKLPYGAIALLREAARVLSICKGAPPSVLIAFGRYQESIFRTIDTMVRRSDAVWADFDDVVAAAVQAIPQAIAGQPAVCNAQVRATVATLRTAIRLVRVSSPASETKNAVAPLFLHLHERALWSNVGIVEGCLRGVPDLIVQPAHDDLTRIALNVVCEDLERPHYLDDLIATHRHLIANSCFRRLLISIVELGLEHHLKYAPESEELNVERNIRILLRHPTPDNVLRIIRHQDVPGIAVAASLTPMVVAGVALESELLRCKASMFEGWEGKSTAQKVLLTRILAAQLHAIGRDFPELRRDALLGSVFTGIPTVSMSDKDTIDMIWELLSSLPPDAAETADAEIQRFVEYRPPATHAHDLPGYVLAMISPMASGRIAGAIAREIDLSLRFERSLGGKPDIARSLHQVMLRGPDESIFDHLLPRIREGGDRAVVLLFRKHVANVLHSLHHDGNYVIALILDHIRKFREDLEKETSPTLRAIDDALQMYEALTLDERSVWQTLTSGGLLGLTRKLDGLAKDEHHRKKLEEAFAGKLTDLRDDLAHYVALPVGKFDARAATLKKATDLTKEIEQSLRTHQGLQPPERILLIALMQSLRDLFDRTIRWYCDEARRRRDASDKEVFWLYFCDPRHGDERIAALSALVRGGPEQAQRFLWQRAEDAQIEYLEQLIGDEPPHFPGQRAKFEEFFVNWMASDLDIESLKRELSGRWPHWFRGIYGIITNFWLMSAVILAPCVVAVIMDRLGKHYWEGVGFFILTSVMIIAALLSFTEIIHVLARKIRGLKAEADQPGYWFPCLLPRLARLIAVPMTFIVEFDHSYAFPMNASTFALMLLMVTSFITTRFFVKRELVDRQEQPGVHGITYAERRRIRQIVAVALAHSFGIAVLLSAIFACNLEDRRNTDSALPHSHTLFLHLLPREAVFDLGAIAEKNHRPFIPLVAARSSFRYYPTIVLTWTALGLFFGVFLEGFMKGARLRGARPDEADAEV